MLTTIKSHKVTIARLYDTNEATDKELTSLSAKLVLPLSTRWLAVCKDHQSVKSFKSKRALIEDGFQTTVWCEECAAKRQKMLDERKVYYARKFEDRLVEKYTKKLVQYENDFNKTTARFKSELTDTNARRFFHSFSSGRVFNALHEAARVDILTALVHDLKEAKKGARRILDQYTERLISQASWNNREDAEQKAERVAMAEIIRDFNFDVMMEESRVEEENKKAESC